MKPSYLFFRSIPFYICVVLVLFLTACSGLSPQGTAEKRSGSRPFPDIEKYKDKSSDTKISLVKILSSEAEKFVWQGNFQDALFIYNQALIHAHDSEKPDILQGIENALQKTSAKDIEEFRQIKNIQIPDPLLLYWLGINYGLENKTYESKRTLESFLYLYPDHRYADEARELVQIISKTIFNKDTIGCLLPLSGKYALFGQRALSGIQVAIEELSQKYSHKFKLIVKDTKADPKVAVQCVRELHMKNVAGIIGPLLAVREAGDEAQNLKIPMIALTQKDDFPKQGDFLFANFITPQMQVKTLANYLFGNLGIKKAAILYPDEKYGKKYMNLFWDMADEYGVKIVGVEAYDGKKTDFAAPIQKLTGAALPLPEFLQKKDESPLLDSEVYPDDNLDIAGENSEDQERIDEDKEEDRIQIDFEALFIPDSPAKVKLILPQLAFNDASGMYIVGTNLWHHESLLKDARGYNKQAVISDGFFDDSQNPLTLDFTKKFKNLFGEMPKFLEAVSYDTANIMFSAAMNETVDSRGALKDFLMSGHSFEGVTGTTVFDENGGAQRDLFLITIKKGRFVEISH